MKWLLLLLFLSGGANTVLAQTDSIQPPYLRFPVYPPVKLLGADSSFFSKEDLPKKSPVLLMLFNPQCEHCRREAEDITKNMHLFRQVQIVMATTAPRDSMLAFSQRFGLGNYKNIRVGQDIHYFLPTFFRIRNLPFLAFYTRKKELISVTEGALPVPQIVEILEN